MKTWEIWAFDRLICVVKAKDPKDAIRVAKQRHSFDEKRVRVIRNQRAGLS